jgi:hypothetical protein
MFMVHEDDNFRPYCGINLRTIFPPDRFASEKNFPYSSFFLYYAILYYLNMWDIKSQILLTQTVCPSSIDLT